MSIPSAGAGTSQGQGEGVTDRDDLVQCILVTQEQLGHALAFGRSDPLLAANLTMPQLKVLWVLYLRDNEPSHSGVSGQDLSAALGVSLATMTGIVDRLAGQCLALRQEDPRDRRVRRVQLTQSGRDLVDSIMVAGARHLRRMLDRLSTAELLTVQAATELLLGAAQERHSDCQG